MNINEVTISGNVAREPSRFETSGSALIYFDLAHQKNAVEVELFKCSAIGDTAMNLKKLTKGDYIIIKGRMNSYVAADEGQNNTRLYNDIECITVARCEYIATDRKIKPFKSKGVTT